MKIAITGGTGFAGRHLAQRLTARGDEVVVISRRVVPSGLSDARRLAEAFAGCDAIAHCAGINREIGEQTYARVHVEGTRNVVDAARAAGVRKIVMLSFLRARPACGSAYHESKWAAEELLRHSGLDFTILKSGMIYGRGDHMLDHLSHSIHTIPLLATVGLTSRAIRPVAIDDMVDLLEASLTDPRLGRKTVAVTGAEELHLGDAAKRVAKVLGRPLLTFPAPVWFHSALAWLLERTMKVPLVALAQVRILAEGVVEPWGEVDALPPDLAPRRRFTEEQIARGLPPAGAFGLRDLRCCAP